MQLAILLLGLLLYFIFGVLFLFLEGRARSLLNTLGISLSALQIIGAAWAFVLISKNSAVLTFQIPWISSLGFYFSFVLDLNAVLCWLLQGLIFFFYFLSYQMGDGSVRKLRPQIEYSGVSFLGFYSLLTFTSHNLLLFFLGLMGAVFSLFVFFLFADYHSASGSRKFNTRFTIYNVAALFLILMGFLSLYTMFNTLDFERIYSQVTASSPIFKPMALIVLGALLLCGQAPLLRNIKLFEFSGKYSAFIYLSANALLASAICWKLHPLFQGSQDVKLLSLVPAFTGFFFSLSALTTQSPLYFSISLSNYLVSSIFVAGIGGSFQTAQAVSYIGILSVLMLVFFLTNNIFSEARMLKAFPYLILMNLVGAPIFNWSWGQYLEYGSVAASLNSNDSLRQVSAYLMLVFRALSDFIFSISFWGLFLKYARATSKKQSFSTPVNVAIGFSYLFILLILISGGRPFASIFGESVYSLEDIFGVFESFVFSEAVRWNPSGFFGSDADYISRALTGFTFLVPGLISFFLLFKDQKTSEAFFSKLKKLESFFFTEPTQNSFMDRLLGFLEIIAVKSTHFIESSLLEPASSFFFQAPPRFFRAWSNFWEIKVLDRFFIDGLGKGIFSVGKALRLIHNGQVQFYFKLGLIVLAMILYRFIRNGG